MHRCCTSGSSHCLSILDSRCSLSRHKLSSELEHVNVKLAQRPGFLKVNLTKLGYAKFDFNFLNQCFLFKVEVSLKNYDFLATVTCH